MYGMIHQAARQMVHAVADDATWSKILTTSGLQEEHFISAQTYDDEVTLTLIGAIQSVTEIPLDELLSAFGRYWIEFAASTSYSSVLEMAGNDLETLLENLDRMHTSIKSTMPDADMPSFYVSRVEGRDLYIEYRSSRTGLEAFVKGLLEGLLDRFGDTGEVSFVRRADHVEFAVRREVAEAA
ncbi:MAG: heme NO-binding domain-containing protein [Maricaulis sp.]|uniref:heme NO-binding domain-containing protein n=1 Tax=Maricaulis sp. TaxID=1486257 RepID=UPI00262A8A17|nr:heme NO-binding domain-containing protein [Maricaulis sp.]MDM7983051.1 heme NO-binding domain-containing protein [Maricaulis sp.]